MRPTPFRNEFASKKQTNDREWKKKGSKYPIGCLWKGLRETSSRVYFLCGTWSIKYCVLLHIETESTGVGMQQTIKLKGQMEIEDTRLSRNYILSSPVFLHSVDTFCCLSWAAHQRFYHSFCYCFQRDPINALHLRMSSSSYFANTPQKEGQTSFDCLFYK